MQVNDVIFTLKEGMTYRETENLASCGINLFLNHVIVADELEMQKIMTQEILQNLFGDVVVRLNKINSLTGVDVLKGQEEMRKLIHDMRF